MKHALLGAAAAVLSCSLHATDGVVLPEIVVDATKLDKEQFTMTQSTTVIGEEEIARQAHTDVTEVLRSLAGIEFKQAGGPGQYNYLKMRGFGSSNVLVVIDGVVVNQAGSGDVGNLLSQLDPSSISRIEVLRGPQAVLYGANSTAGVIAITTKRASGASAQLAAEAGSLGWKKLKGDWTHVLPVGDGELRSALYASKVDSDGVHKYEDFRDEEFKLGLDYAGPSVDAGVSYWRSDNRFSYAELTEPYYSVASRKTYWSFQTPDPHQYNDTKTEVASAYLEHRLTDALSHRLQLGYTRKTLKSLDVDDGLLGYATAPFDGFVYPSYGGAVYGKGDAIPIHDAGDPLAATNEDKSTQLNYSLRYARAGLKALAGVEKYDSSTKQWGRYGDFRANADHHSVYLNGEYAFGASGLVLSAGARHDDYDDWAEKTTGSVGASYRLGAATTVYANYGTSYRVPTLSQLYDPSYGSASLQPESGRTFEMGVRQRIGAAFDWEATFWHSRLEDVVIYDYSIPNPKNPYGGYGQYANADEQRTRGVELSFAYAFDERWTLKGNYTYTDSHTESAAGDYGRTVQIARNKANLGVDYRHGPLSAGASAYYAGPRLRWNRDVEKKEYVRVDVSARYQWSKQLAAYARVENLFDAEIEEGLGYEQPGVYGVVGLEYRFF